MSPVDWAMRPLKKYADFRGRAPRAEYWWFYLLLLIVYLSAMIIDSMVGTSMFGPYGTVTGIVLLGLTMPSLAAGVRRLHDSNRSGWWIVAPIVPYVAAIAMMGPAVFSSATMEPGATGMGSLGSATILLLVGLALAITVFVFLVLPGTRGPNKYGDDPYAGSVAAAV